MVACSGTDAGIPSGSPLNKTDAGSGPPQPISTTTSTGTATGTATATATATGTATGSPTSTATGTSTADAGPPHKDAGPPPPPAATWTSQPTTSSGCGQAANTSPTNGDMGSVTVNGVTRTFVYYVPASYDPSHAYPLVTLFHGIGATGAEMAAYIMMQVYSAPNAITAFPDALNGQWDLSGTTDLQFMDALNAQLESRLCINEQRTFALGFSYGAYFANHYGCNRPTVRAFVAADGGYTDTSACKAPVAALIYHRQEDDNEVIANGINARNQWLANDGCSTNNTPFSSDGFQAPGGDVSGPAGCVIYSGCSVSTAPVLWCDDMYINPQGYKHDLRDVYRTPMWNWFDSFQ